jgi:hypothetical protein
LLIAIACGYFAYREIAEIRAGDFESEHNWWNILTWFVWTALAAGLISEVRCWRERLLFAVLLGQFLLSLVSALWAAAPFTFTRDARWFSFALWCLAALVGLLARLSRRSPHHAGDAKA